MSMEHKAFLFNYDEFDSHLKKILINSLLEDNLETFQSRDRVENNLETIRKCLQQKPELSTVLKNLILMLQKAFKSQQGLYITF